MTRWIIERSQGFTNIGLLRISESVRAYAHLVFSLQASVRSKLIANTASALTVQQAFLKIFRISLTEEWISEKTLSITKKL